ncbi:hypothetical protein [Mitsuokella multacida]|jgi:hypothetical protein|uniref:hypothetical protein n=1 Tax=Mitsuokella multacida TaxID=52226 RepID=UPI003FA31D67
MKRLFAVLIVVALAALSAAMPSDLIQKGPKPGLLALSGTTPESAKAIDALNEPLGMFRARDIPNIGHYASWAATYDQDLEAPVGVPEKLLNFTKMKIDLPENISESDEVIYL